MPTPYEKSREENIKRNRELLMSLGLDELKTYVPPKATKKDVPPAAKSRKRKSPPPEDDTDLGVKAVKTRAAQDTTNTSGVRRSARNAGKTIDYKSEVVQALPGVVSAAAKIAMNSERRANSERRQNPKQYGSIPGIEVGEWWPTREACSADAVHAPWVAGIASGKDGAYSICLSGGYEDDVDEGYAFTYTGSGGRDLKGTKTAPKNLRTAPQSSDQTFDNNFNKALKVSTETGKPVRVVRGFKNRSQYGPEEGYRYDGLYQVLSAWTERGLNPGGYLVCKYTFRRLPNQPQIPTRTRDGDSEISEDGDGEENENYDEVRSEDVAVDED
ncbi:PUA-like domain-containing protein [Thelephora terrestris]|uniref:PUA-like domain-containing protein n=1 Tax=Thelephora terrestris TaxID=56493 RepID=A0A9P6H7D5_9AGAM|nr:PUA-like domain-containing protein [Thelephora terrestris]